MSSRGQEQVTPAMFKSSETEGDRELTEQWFPGRSLGGTSMILGPLLLLTGILLRIQFHFFFPQQLAAFHQHPMLITASYNCFLAGNLLLWPAVITIARLI